MEMSNFSFSRSIVSILLAAWRCAGHRLTSRAIASTVSLLQRRPQDDAKAEANHLAGEGAQPSRSATSSPGSSAAQKLSHHGALLERFAVAADADVEVPCRRGLATQKVRVHCLEFNGRRNVDGDHPFDGGVGRRATAIFEPFPWDVNTVGPETETRITECLNGSISSMIQSSSS